VSDSTGHPLQTSHHDSREDDQEANRAERSCKFIKRERCSKYTPNRQQRRNRDSRENCELLHPTKPARLAQGVGWRHRPVTHSTLPLSVRFFSRVTFMPRPLSSLQSTSKATGMPASRVLVPLTMLS